MPASLPTFGWQYYDQLQPTQEQIALVALFRLEGDAEESVAVTVTPVKAGLYSIAPETPLQAGMTYRLEIPDMCASCSLPTFKLVSVHPFVILHPALGHSAAALCQRLTAAR